MQLHFSWVSRHKLHFTRNHLVSYVGSPTNVVVRLLAPQKDPGTVPLQPTSVPDHHDPPLRPPPQLCSRSICCWSCKPSGFRYLRVWPQSGNTGSSIFTRIDQN